MHKIPIKVGDVVYAEGASALLGDVVSIDEDEDAVEVRWRQAFSTESTDDLTVVVDDEPEMARIRESSEVLAFMERTFQYRSVQNLQRADRGRKLIESHPDFGKMTDSGPDEVLTAATDTIADVLHGLVELGLVHVEGSDVALAGGAAPFTAGAVLNRALRAYEGDYEDEVGV